MDQLCLSLEFSVLMFIALSGTIKRPDWATESSSTADAKVMNVWYICSNILLVCCSHTCNMCVAQMEALLVVSPVLLCYGKFWIPAVFSRFWVKLGCAMYSQHGAQASRSANKQFPLISSSISFWMYFSVLVMLKWGARVYSWKSLLHWRLVCVW